MSKHRIKSIAIDDDYDYQDDYDDGADQTGNGNSGYDAEEDSAITETDRAKLRSGSVQVRAALGLHGAAIADWEIEDALWHYYYDVAKSVSYLKSMAWTKLILLEPRC